MKTWSVIVLSGGTNKRFGSDKCEALLHGITLLDHVLSFIPNEINTVVVGKDVFEEPPLGGPVAGIKSVGNAHTPVHLCVIREQGRHGIRRRPIRTLQRLRVHGQFAERLRRGQLEEVEQCAVWSRRDAIAGDQRGLARRDPSTAGG